MKDQEQQIKEKEFEIGNEILLFKRDELVKNICLLILKEKLDTFFIIKHLIKAETVCQKLLFIYLKDIPSDKRLTETFDNGKEFSEYGLIKYYT